MAFDLKVGYSSRKNKSKFQKLEKSKRTECKRQVRALAVSTLYAIYTNNFESLLASLQLRTHFRHTAEIIHM